jgi:hypothetical protein
MDLGDVEMLKKFNTGKIEKSTNEVINYYSDMII